LKGFAQVWANASQLVQVSIPVSQEELAQLVGLSRGRVNRALKRLEGAGLLRVKYRRVTILDLEAL
jgi:CRP/FNR family cyclic AMP-dependent transcriptional regulator